MRPHEGMRVLEHLHIGDPSLHDGQTDLHIDAPFNTHKLWLYLDDVTPDHAPFVYVPMSHKLDWVRLRGDYLESIGENFGSRKIGDEEVLRRGLETRGRDVSAQYARPSEYLRLPLSCCRRARATRRSLHMMFRSNPFSVRRRFRRWTGPPLRCRAMSSADACRSDRLTRYGRRRRGRGEIRSRVQLIARRCSV